jgi:starvation-inducible DNA-binding protein
MLPNTGINEENAKQTDHYLKDLFFNQFRFYMKSWNFHWNTTGPRFIMLHEMFKDIYEAQPEIIDNIAERIRQLGFKVPITLQEIALEKSYIGEDDIESDFSENEMIGKLLSDIQILIREIRNIITHLKEGDDFGTCDFLTKVLEDHEKTAWFLRSHLLE